MLLYDFFGLNSFYFKTHFKQHKSTKQTWVVCVVFLLSCVCLFGVCLLFCFVVMLCWCLLFCVVYLLLICLIYVVDICVVVVVVGGVGIVYVFEGCVLFIWFCDLLCVVIFVVLVNRVCLFVRLMFMFVFVVLLSMVRCLVVLVDFKCCYCCCCCCCCCLCFVLVLFVFCCLVALFLCCLQKINTMF